MVFSKHPWSCLHSSLFLSKTSGSKWLILRRTERLILRCLTLDSPVASAVSAVFSISRATVLIYSAPIILFRSSCSSLECMPVDSIGSLSSSKVGSIIDKLSDDLSSTELTSKQSENMAERCDWTTDFWCWKLPHYVEASPVEPNDSICDSLYLFWLVSLFPFCDFMCLKECWSRLFVFMGKSYGKVSDGYDWGSVISDAGEETLTFITSLMQINYQYLIYIF